MSNLITLRQPLPRALLRLGSRAVGSHRSGPGRLLLLLLPLLRGPHLRRRWLPAGARHVLRLRLWTDAQTGHDRHPHGCDAAVGPRAEYDAVLPHPNFVGLISEARAPLLLRWVHELLSSPATPMGA